MKILYKYAMESLNKQHNFIEIDAVNPKDIIKYVHYSQGNSEVVECIVRDITGDFILLTDVNTNKKYRIKFHNLARRVLELKR